MKSKTKPMLQDHGDLEYDLDIARSIEAWR